MSHFLLVALMVLLCSSTHVTAQTSTDYTCGTAGYDISSLGGRDLTFTSGLYTYYFRPCGIVSASSDYYCNNKAAMLCQIYNAPIRAIYALSRTYAQYSTWSPIANGTGIQVIATDGDHCDAVAAPRVTRAVYVCAASATVAYIGSIQETSTCYYTMFVYTNLVCNVMCSGAGVDLSYDARRDLSLVVGDWTYYVRACGVVTNNARCTGLGASVCQAHRSNQNVFALARPGGQWDAVAQGVSVTFSNGDYCEPVRGNRTVITMFTCSSLTRLVSVTETTCQYHAIIETPSACSGTIPSASSTGLPSLISSSLRVTSSSVASSTGLPSLISSSTRLSSSSIAASSSFSTTSPNAVQSSSRTAVLPLPVASSSIGASSSFSTASPDAIHSSSSTAAPSAIDDISSTAPHLLNSASRLTTTAGAILVSFAASLVLAIA